MMITDSAFDAAAQEWDEASLDERVCLAIDAGSMDEEFGASLIEMIPTCEFLSREDNGALAQEALRWLGWLRGHLASDHRMLWEEYRAGQLSEELP